MEPSGADKGFFQTAPALQNQFYEDVTFQRSLSLFLPKNLQNETSSEMAQLGSDVLADDVFAWITDSEHNKPYLKGSGRSSFGTWEGQLITTEGWRKLQEFGQAKGFVADGYETAYGSFARSRQFLRMYLWEGSSANVTCPTGMQDGAARVLQVHLASDKLDPVQRQVFENAFAHLTSRDPAHAWTSGQWMTERPGGSDISKTETIAVHSPGETAAAFASKEEGIPLGPWRINGFKWFSSATDSNMTLLTARTAKGLSTFMAPLRKHDQAALTAAGNPDAKGTTLNGVRIQRLKNKLGTQSLPTAELVLEDMRGWLIGDEGRGIQEMGVLLNLTRIHTTSQAVGYAARGLAVARAFARVREVGAGRGARQPLLQSQLHMQTLARMTAEHRANSLLHMFTASILGLSEQPAARPAEYAPSPALAAITPPPEHAEPLLRVLTSVSKAYVCTSSLRLLYACMEAMGGVGYLLNEESEYLNIARLYRDAAVLPIWEGTTDVLSTDFIRAITRPETGSQSLEGLNSFVIKALQFGDSASGSVGTKEIYRAWKKIYETIKTGTYNSLLRQARDLLHAVGDVLVATLLHVDALSDGDEAAREIFLRFVDAKFLGSAREMTPKAALELDTAIVYGTEKLPLPAKL